MMLMGAEVLFYPTAIGTEPHDPSLDTARLWRRAMLGHAVSNVVPVVAANRIGTEHGQTFYGHQLHLRRARRHPRRARREEEGVLVATLDLDRVKRHRAAFGFFRDRRPELYGRLVAGHLTQRQRPREHRFEHRGVEPAGVLVVARAVIAIDQDAAVGQAVLGEVAERRLGQPPAQRLDRRLVRDLAERDEHAHVGQRRQLRLEERAAGADFLGRRLVLRRQASDRVEDDRAVQRETVVGALAISCRSARPNLRERRVQQHARR